MALALALFGGEVPWGQFLLYWVGPLVGAVVAAVLYDLVAETRRAQAPAAEESYTPSPPEEA